MLVSFLLLPSPGSVAPMTFKQLKVVVRDDDGKPVEAFPEKKWLNLLIDLKNFLYQLLTP